MAIPVADVGSNATLETASSEGRSALASIVTQLVTTLRAIMNFALTQIGKLVQWAGENPLASILLIANMAIWMQ